MYGANSERRDSSHLSFTCSVKNFSCSSFRTSARSSESNLAASPISGHALASAAVSIFDLGTRTNTSPGAIARFATPAYPRSSPRCLTSIPNASNFG